MQTWRIALEFYLRDKCYVSASLYKPSHRGSHSYHSIIFIKHNERRGAQCILRETKVWIPSRVKRFWTTHGYSWHTDFDIIRTWLLPAVRLFTITITNHATYLITLCTSSKEVWSPQCSEQLFASFSLGVSATLLWFCFQNDFCPCCLGKCIYNVLIQEFHIQQMAFLAMYSLCFLWAELSA